MNKGLYIVASDHYRDVVWKNIITALSSCGTDWIVDSLDCLYATDLKPGFHFSYTLLAELDHNTDVFSARMIGIPIGQTLSVNIMNSDDYFNSNCQSIVLCADGVYFEVFSKNHELLLHLYDSFPDNSVENVEWIDDSLGGRLEFTV